MQQTISFLPQCFHICIVCFHIIRYFPIFHLFSGIFRRHTHSHKRKCRTIAENLRNMGKYWTTRKYIHTYICESIVSKIVRKIYVRALVAVKDDALHLRLVTSAKTRTQSPTPGLFYSHLQLLLSICIEFPMTFMWPS